MQMKQTYEVYVNIYDFTSANKVLGCLGLGAYHTGVELKYPTVYSATSNTATQLYRRTPMKRVSS